MNNKNDICVSHKQSNVNNFQSASTLSVDIKKYCWTQTCTPGTGCSDVWFTSAQVGWTVTNRGQILHTTDGGDSWTCQFELKRKNGRGILRSMQFIDEQTGWVGILNDGDGRLLLKTSDGGKCWETITRSEICVVPGNTNKSVKVEPPKGVCGIHMVSSSVIYVSGTYSLKNCPPKVMKTTDGGVTWQITDMSAHASTLIDIFFFDEKRGFVVGGYAKCPDDLSQLVPVVLYTDNGGETWTNQVPDAEHHFEKNQWGWKIDFLDQNQQIGYVSLESPCFAAILKTQDGGMNWQYCKVEPSPSSRNQLQGIGFVTADHGWVGSQIGPSSVTYDGGETWTNVEILENVNRFRVVKDKDKDIVYAAGEYVYRGTPMA
ncbi:MAG: YCF48-related protein [Chloroflexota bacterium]